MRHQKKTWPDWVAWVIGVLLVLRICDLTFSDPTNPASGKARYNFCLAQTDSIKIFCFLGLE
jgi:hypothetical protein